VEITKKVTTTTKYKITQAGLDMMHFDESYRRIRGNYKYKGFECFMCKHHFEDGEKISLAITDKGNKTICHDCAVEIQKEMERIENE
jgi:hypothetical protein